MDEPSPSWFQRYLAGLALQMYSQMSGRGDGMKDMLPCCARFSSAVVFMCLLLIGQTRCNLFGLGSLQDFVGFSVVLSYKTIQSAEKSQGFKRPSIFATAEDFSGLYTHVAGEEKKS